MSRLATVTIRNKRNGKTRIINEQDWSHDLGKGRYDGWERVGRETHGDEAAPQINVEAEAEAARQREAAALSAELEAEQEVEAADDDEAEDTDDAEDAPAFSTEGGVLRSDD